MKISLFFALIICASCFAEVYFEDNFDDGNDDGWIKSGSAGFLVINGEYNIFAGGLRGYGLTVNGDNSGIMSFPDYSIRSTLRFECGLNAAIVARYNTSDDWYYQLVFKPYSNLIVLERTKLNGPTLTLDEFEVFLYVNQEYFIRFQVDGDMIQGKVWSGTAEDEPFEWHIEAEDNIQSNPGSFGLFTAGYGNKDVPWSAVFDDVIVTSPIEESFAQKTWASIKYLTW